MKFCCEKFKSNYELGKIYEEGKLVKELYPNIKIIKLQADKYNEGKNLYRYFLVCGFLSDNPPVISMKYCPFCGTHLYDFYKADEYVNEKAETFES